MTKEADHYNKFYSENHVTFGKGQPDSLIKSILEYRTSGSVLELGAGDGRNALFLAEHGFLVKAQDISEVGVEKIRKQAQERNLIIETEVSDLRTMTLDKSFDIIMCTFVLHHLSLDEAQRLIQQMRLRTNPGGLNAIATFTDNGDFYRKNPDSDNFYPSENKLKDFYPDWEIIKYSEAEGKAFAKKADGTDLVNVSARLLARKPI